MMSSPLFLLTSLSHDHSSPSLLGLRFPSTSWALELGNAKNIRAFNLGVAAFFAIGLSFTELPHHFNLIYLTIPRTELKEENLGFS